MKFKKFKILDIFFAQKNSGIISRDRIKGDIPYVSAKNNNNGVSDYIATNKLVRKNFIGLNNDGQGGIGLAFFHPYEAIISNHVIALIPKQELNENEMLYICTCIETQTKKFSRAYSINNIRLSKISIYLPVTRNNTIDFSYMNNFMQEIKNKKMQKKFESYSLNIKFESYETFYLTELFEIIRGDCKNIKTALRGNIPVVSASGVNNGISNYIQDGNGTIYYNCLTISNNGTTGVCFYHPYEFVASSDVSILIPKSDYTTEFMLFLLALIESQTQNFSYGYKIKKTGFEKIRILLPINKDFQIDHTNIKNVFSCKFSYDLF